MLAVAMQYADIGLPGSRLAEVIGAGLPGRQAMADVRSAIDWLRSPLRL